MLKRALVFGLAGGIILSLSGLYPLVALLAPAWLTGWERPFANVQVHGLWLVASAVLGLPVLLGLGFWAAHRAQARGWKQGALAGIVAAVPAALLCYLTLVLPAVTLYSYSLLITSRTDISASRILPAFTFTFNGRLVAIELLLLAVGLLWGLQGAILGWRRRKTAVPLAPEMLTLLEEEKSLKNWFAQNDTAVPVGLTVGGLVGMLLLLLSSSWPLQSAAQEWPKLAQQIWQSRPGRWLSLPGLGGVPFLHLFSIISLLVFGLVVVLLLKNPPNRWRDRLAAVLLAGGVISMVVAALLLRLFYFNLTLTPFLTLRLLAMEPSLTLSALDTLQTIELVLQTPGSLLTGMLIAPWLALAVGLLVGLGLAALQGALALPLVARLRPQPVDHAARLLRQIRRRPDEVMPLIFGLFTRTPRVYEVLAQLAVQSQPALPKIARVAAAYHTLGCTQTAAQQEKAIQTVGVLLQEERRWDWAAGLASAYSTFGQALLARSLPEIAAIAPPPGQHIAPLPERLRQNGRQLRGIIAELQKAEQAQDLPTRLIFLENALGEIDETLKSNQVPVGMAPLPHQSVLLTALANWQKAILAARQRLKGQAEIVFALQTNQTGFMPELPLVCRVKNSGLQAARQVRLKVLPGKGYHLLGIKSEAAFDQLPAGGQQELTLTVVPEPNLTQMRLNFTVRYADAVDYRHEISFSETFEFSRPERPFRRVFPIPYVTGSPLKGDDVFVGRHDLFRFIEESLVGQSQNNIIILHGPRRIGKTSILYRLPKILAGTHIAVLIDMQGKPARGEADFLYSVADDIVFALNEAGIQVELPPRSAFNEAPEFFFRARFLRSLLPHLGQKNLLLLLDEFEELERRVEDGRLQPGIFPFLHSLMQHESRLDFIFAGRQTLASLPDHHWSVLYNIATYRPITCLTPEETHHLIVDPVAPFHVAYDPLAVDRLIGVSAGHPYFAQLLLHEMMVYHNEMEVSYLTTVDVDQVIARILAAGEAHFHFILAESSEEEKRLLGAAAELSQGGEAIKTKEIRLFLSERGHVSTDHWESALDSLVNREILQRSEGKLPLYRFQVELVRLYLAGSQPLPTAREEDGG